MKKVNLKEVLGLSEIKNGINNNFFRDEVSVEKAIKDSIENGDNVTSVKVTVNGIAMDFENTLHVDEIKEVFFLESRLFTESGGMVNAYLEILDKDLNIIEEYQDDVWDYANWSVVKNVA